MNKTVDNPQFHTEKIAIVLATYNGAEYLKEQLDSLLAQTNQDWITYIHDDGSTDDTAAVIDEYVAKYPQKFVKIEGKSTGGAKQNFFYLLSAVDAPYLMCCDQDDVWLPEKVETTYQAMKELEKEEDGDKKPFLVFTELRVVDGRLQTIAERMSDYQQLDCTNTTLNRMLVQNVVTGCTMMINRTLREMLNGQNTGHKMNMDRIIMHDWWAALIATQFGKIRFLEQPQILYRQHEDNSVGAKQAGSLSYIRKRLQNIEDIKHSLLLTRVQAAEFEQCFGLWKDELVHGYAVIGEQSQRKRRLFYKKHDIQKTGKARKIGMWIWG